MLRTGLFVALVTFLTTSLALAQESRSEFGLQGSGFVTKATSGNSVTSESATKTAGFLINYRYHLSHGLSLEGAYGYDRNTQKYTLTSGGGNFRIPSNNHEFTFDLVQSLRSFGKARFSPYVLVGGGALVFSPASTQSTNTYGAQTQTKAAFAYGGGLNYALTRRVSLRFEYRGLLYSAPDFGFGGLNTNSVTHSAQPSVGLSFRF
jgi:opacity protein-like surface antigen